MKKALPFVLVMLLAILGYLFVNGAKGQKTDPTFKYIEQYRDIAIRLGDSMGIPSMIILAQAILESKSGQSKLVEKSKNHFGIKAFKKDWNGPYVLHTDDSPQERFRSYKTAYDSYLDHSHFLKRKSRYAFLFLLDPCDYRAWAHGLKKAGYATNPKYPEILIRIIKRYRLDKLKYEEINVSLNE